jgi:hypothetical protein
MDEIPQVRGHRKQHAAHESGGFLGRRRLTQEARGQVERIAVSDGRSGSQIHALGGHPTPQFFQPDPLRLSWYLFIEYTLAGSVRGANEPFREMPAPPAIGARNGRKAAILTRCVTDA